MAFQRATFTVTADTNGMGSADVTLKLPSSLTRHAYLTEVTVDPSAAAIAYPMVTVSQLDDVSSTTYDSTGTADVDGTDYALGQQLFFVDLSDPGHAGDLAVQPTNKGVYDFSPRRSAQAWWTGDATSFGDSSARPLIRSKKLRCEVEKVGSGDVVTVNVYYETAGDYRF